MMQLGTRGMVLQTEWTSRVDTVVTEMWNESLNGAAPCNYAFCVAGSGTRNEASPYSDLDCFLLVATESAPNVLFFKNACERMKAYLGKVEGNSGLRFCNIMSPFGDPSNGSAPHLIRTPQTMASLVEMPEDRIHSHISGGLKEHRFLLGTQTLYNDYKVDLNTIVAKTCFTFSSRPIITRGKKMGLQIIKDTVNNPKFSPPKRDDKFFHVKEQFYRPVQFLAKGLAWYYGVDAVSTAQQITMLNAANRMSTVTMNNFKSVMNAMASLRFKLHLDREGEKDFVYLDDNLRNAEMGPLALKGQNATADEKERLNRLRAGTKLTAPEVKELTDSIASLTYLMSKGRAFVTEKEKLLGTRRNPFA